MSKKLLGILLSITLIAAMCCTAVVSASADSAIAKTDTTVDDGGKGLHAGDQIAFTASLTYGNDADEDFVAAIDASVYYDSSVLSVAKKSNGKPQASFASFMSTTANYDLDGEVKFNAADGANGLRTYDEENDVVTASFANGNKIVSITFDVNADVDSTAIGFEARELFNMEDEAITDGVTYDVKVTCNKQDTPSDTDEPQPSDTDEPQPSDTDEPVPSDTDEPVPSDTDEPVPSDTDEPVPSDTDEPVPSDTDEPVPSDTDEPIVEPSDTDVPSDTDEPVVPSDTDVPTPSDTDTTDTEEPAPVVTSDTDTTDATSSDAGKTSPVTGDATATLAIVLVLAAAAVVAVVARKRFA